MPDGTVDKDRACNRKRHGPENRAIIRKPALNIHKTAGPDIAPRRNRRRAGWSDAGAGSVAGQADSPRARALHAIDSAGPVHAMLRRQRVPIVPAAPPVLSCGH